MKADSRQVLSRQRQPLIICLVVTLFLSLAAAPLYAGLLDTGSNDDTGAQEDPLAAAREAYFARQAAEFDPDAGIQTAHGATPCVGGSAAGFPCQDVDLLAHLPLASIGGGTNGADSWGWKDADTGVEYAIVGRHNGTSFIDLSDPANPVYLGNLPPHNGVNSLWRDIKVYADHAFIVSEASGHGIQVFNLAQLALVNSPPVTFSETAHYDDFGSAHNLVINEESGYAYGVGANNCSGGLHMVNIQNPTSPVFAGCYSADGYTHDAQCVNYAGPDADHAGSEICLAANEDTVTIVDVTDKNNPTLIHREARAGCVAFATCYIHQGWLTENHEYFIVDDELDELNGGLPETRTYIYDVRDLDNPILINHYDHGNPATDHNLYIKCQRIYEANYASGLRILDGQDVANGNLSLLAYFDTYPANNNAGFSGAWTAYPFHDSGIVTVSDYNSGFFVLQPQLNTSLLAEDSAMTDVPPGEHATHVFNVTNCTGTATTFSLQVSGYEWSTTVMNIFPLDLADGETGQALVRVTVPYPSHSPVNGSDAFTLTITSDADLSDTISVQGTTSYAVTAGLSIGPAHSVQSGLPTETVTHTFQVTNTGTTTDIINLTLGATEWSTSLSADEVTLGAGEASQLEVQVTLPPTVTQRTLQPTSDTFTLTATSSLDPQLSETVTGTTTSGVVAGVEITSFPLQAAAPISQQVVFQAVITNTGNFTDNISLSLSGNEWPAELSASQVEVGSAMSVTVQITVTVGAPGANEITLQAQSGLDPLAVDSTTLTAFTYTQFLPALKAGD